MARRGGRKSPRRRRKTFSISNAIFSLGFASILSQGFFRTNILTFFLQGTGVGNLQSGGGISLVELLQRPEDLGATALRNARIALPTMVMQSFGLAVSERLFKKLMAMPLRRINSGIVTPLLGKGIRV